MSNEIVVAIITLSATIVTTIVAAKMDTLGMETVLNQENKFEIVKAPFDVIFFKMDEKLLSSMFVSVPDYASDDFFLTMRNILKKCK